MHSGEPNKKKGSKIFRCFLGLNKSSVGLKYRDNLPKCFQQLQDIGQLLNMLVGLRYFQSATGEISSNLYRVSVCDTKKELFLLISLSQILHYEEEQSQGYNRRTMCSFINFSSNKNVCFFC